MAQKSLIDLLTERDKLVAQLQYDHLSDQSREHLAVEQRIDEIDLAISAAPAASLSDLHLKLQLLRRFWYPINCPIPETSQDSILFKSVLDDVARLVEEEPS